MSAQGAKINKAQRLLGSNVMRGRQTETQIEREKERGLQGRVGQG